MTLANLLNVFFVETYKHIEKNERKVIKFKFFDKK